MITLIITRCAERIDRIRSMVTGKETEGDNASRKKTTGSVRSRRGSSLNPHRDTCFVTAANRAAISLLRHYRGGLAPNASLNISADPLAMNSRSGSATRCQRSLIALALTALTLAACAAPSPDVSMTPPLASPSTPVERVGLPRFAQTGLASWYERTRKMVRTANGEKLGADKMTAAHRTLPMDTIVRVTNLNNGASVQVRINDRGPFVPGRIIDLTHDAATALGMKDDGVAPVRLEVYDQDQVAKEDIRRTAAK